MNGMHQSKLVSINTFTPLYKGIVLPHPPHCIQHSLQIDGG